MINWAVIEERLDGPLREVLLDLYWAKDKSLRDISAMLGGYPTETTIRDKMVSLKIPLKNRGGPNNRLPIEITLEEFQNEKVEYLCAKYGVSNSVILNRFKAFRQAGHKRLFSRKDPQKS